MLKVLTSFSAKTHTRLIELDCLRGLAILLVVFCHFTLGNELSKYGFKFGATGVELFFIISGFVIFLTVERNTNFFRFLFSRFARLFPIYWVSVTLTTIIIMFYNKLTRQTYSFPSLRDYLFNMSMLEDFFNVRKIDNVYWSLTIELMFYFFISILLILNQLKRIEIIGFFIVILCLINQFYLKLKVPLVYNFFSEYYSIVFTFPLFIAGIMFYKIKFDRITISRVILICFCYIIQILMWEPLGGHALETRFQYGVIIFIYFTFFALYHFNYLGFVVNRVLLFIGKISYPLYLTHSVIFASILVPILTRSNKIHFNYYVATFLICFPMALILAYVLNRFVGNPTRKKLNGRI